MSAAPITATLPRVPGFEVLAKRSGGAVSPLKFTNRTQAERRATELGEPWAVRTFGGRVFYVSREVV